MSKLDDLRALREARLKPMARVEPTKTACAVPGEPCPTCGRKVPKPRGSFDKASYMREYMRRKRETARK